MPSKQDLLDEIRAELDVIEFEETQTKELGEGATQYSYRVVHLDGDGLAKTQGFHIAVQGQGSGTGNAHFMGRKPRWRQPDTSPELTESDLRTAVGEQLGGEVIQVRGSGDTPLEFTAHLLDSSDGTVAKQDMIAYRDSSDSLVVKTVVDQTSSSV